MFSYERMIDENVQRVSADTSPALTSNSEQATMESTDSKSQMAEDSMSAATSPSGGSGSSISSEDLESRIDSDPAAILPSCDLPGVFDMNNGDPSASKFDGKSLETPENLETQPNDYSYRVPPPELPLYPPPAALPVTDNLEAMEMPNYGTMEEPIHQEFPKNPVGANPLMPQGPNHPPAMNLAMAIGFYPPVNTNALAPQTDPYPQFSNIPGYKGIGGDGNGKFLPPPPVLGPGPDALPTPSNTGWTIPSISKETAKQALADYVSSQCCYSSSPVQEMEIQQMKPFNTYRYRLETFTESRSCQWATKPLAEDDKNDGPSNGPAPQPWDVILEPPQLFHEETKKQPVPHTSSKKECDECRGKGKIICQTCNGNGWVSCTSCDGSGRRFEDECSFCGGTGSRRCQTCIGSNVQTCPSCSGKGQVVSYIELTVTWKNNQYEFIPEHYSEFPTELFKYVTGHKLFADEQPLVPPLLDFPEASITLVSQMAVQQHYSKFISSSRILKQRQTIEWLPLTKVDYNWRGISCSYFVYGRENKVETKDYPATCCCVIL